MQAVSTTFARMTVLALDFRCQGKGGRVCREPQSPIEVQYGPMHG